MIGRFISPDTIVSEPADPQELNRFSYTRNNPIKYTDPTGHKKRKWWQYFGYDFNPLRHPFKLPSSDNSWKDLWRQYKAGAKDVAIATAIAFVFSGFNPVVAGAAFFATATTSTDVGKSFVTGMGEDVFDDVFGMSPKNAYIAASITTNIGLTIGFEMLFANLAGSPVTAVKFDPSKHKIEGSSAQGKLFGPDAKSAKLSGYTNDKFVALMSNEGQVGTLGVDRVSSLGLDKAPLKALNMTHTAVDLVGYSGGKVNPLMYGTWGVCHTAVNASLLKAGFSSTLISLGQGGWSTYLSTVVYGNYGGGLYRTAYAGYKAQKEYNDNK